MTNLVLAVHRADGGGACTDGHAEGGGSGAGEEGHDGEQDSKDDEVA